MYDLHCHLLPGIDDGARDLDEALEMARGLVAMGFHTVAASPHTGAGPGGDVPPALAAQKRAELVGALAAAKVPLTVPPNSEHMMGPLLLERLDRGEVLPLGEAGRWLFVELPWMGLADVEGALFRVQAKGWRVLLAHPERQDFLDLPCLERLVDRGVKLQLELGSAISQFGDDARRMADALVAAGCAHVLATDLHEPTGLAHMARALVAARRRWGEEAVERGLVYNPAALLASASPDDVPAMGA
jgi:protein-tyrosine phosphatase